MALIPKDGRIDRLGGRLLYRAFGGVFALIMLGTAFTAFGAFAAGDHVAGAIFAAIAAGLLLLVRWCFSSKRRLHEGEWC